MQETTEGHAESRMQENNCRATSADGNFVLSQKCTGAGASAQHATCVSRRTAESRNVPDFNSAFQEREQWVKQLGCW